MVGGESEIVLGLGWIIFERFLVLSVFGFMKKGLGFGFFIKEKFNRVWGVLESLVSNVLDFGFFRSCF